MSSLSTGSPPMVEEKLGWSRTIPGSCIKSAKRLHCNRLALWKDNPNLSSSPMSPRASPAGPVRWRPATRRPSSSPDEGCGSGRSAAPARTGARSARRAGRDRSVRLPGPTGDPDRRRPGLPPGPGDPAPGAPGRNPAGPAQQPRFTTGRLSSSDLTVDQPTVGRQHAVMFQHGGAWYVADSNSTNGTFVNRVPVVGRFDSRAPTRSAPERSYDCFELSVSPTSPT